MKASRKRDEPSIEDVKARTSIVALVSRDIPLTKRGRDHWAGCPFHAEKTASFKVSEERREFRCFGCGTHGDVLDYLRRVHGMQLPEALEYLAIEAGLCADREGRRRPTRQPTAPPIAHGGSPCQDNPNGPLALDIWRAAQPAPGTPGEAYLRHRSVTIPIPPTLRYHPGVRYERSGLLLPCMVTAIQAPDRKVTAIHRTYIRDDGRGKANVSTQKMALGPMGDGAVRLGSAGPALGIAEGIETALSASQIFDIPVWAALSVGRLPSIWLPPDVIEVQVFGDNGERGHEGAEKARQAFNEQGRRVVLRFPPERFEDWNDVLCEEAAA